LQILLYYDNQQRLLLKPFIQLSTACAPVKKISPHRRYLYIGNRFGHIKRVFGTFSPDK